MDLFFPNFSDDLFWQLWQQHEDYLYRRCLEWMNGNPTEAEDALSTAMLKAKEKMAQWVGAIDNVKGWLTQLTRNLCIDIHRRRRTQAVESLENIENVENIEVLRKSGESETPESFLEAEEEKIVVRRAIARLPNRLRETFLLHFKRELSYQEIADRQNISYANVRKRVSQARGILKQVLREYFVLSPQPPLGRGAIEVLSPQPPLERGA
ncbi:sigma-70 family RNA polymerase sigma factor, partial [Phormidium sp. CCY1219]|nr:sigma-70 family RNA polymerase sigma factor [Phormidium sp. CCY1219]